MRAQLRAIIGVASTLLLLLSSGPSPVSASRHLQPNEFDLTNEAAAKAQPPPWRGSSSSPIVELSGDKFHATVDIVGLAVAIFHAPWSAACQHQYPLFQQVAKEMAALHPSVLFVSVDISQSQNQHLGEKFDLLVVPSWFVLRYGHEYQGEERLVPRDKAGVFAYLENLLRSTPHKAATPADALAWVDPKTEQLPKSFNGSAKIAFAFLRNVEAQEAFFAVAKELPHCPFSFVYTDSSSVFKAYNMEKDGIVIYHSPNDPDADGEVPHRLDLSRLANSAKKQQFAVAIRSWLAEHSMPLVGDFTETTKIGYLHKRHPMLLIFHHHSSARSPHTEAAKLVAKRWRNVTFAFVNPVDHPALVRALANSESISRNGFAVALMVDRTKYRYSESVFSADLVAQFLYDVYISKAVEPFRLSAPSLDLPEYGSGSIFNIAYDQFSKVVLNPKKDVLVLLQHQNCQRCVSLQAVLSQLAVKYSGVPTLVFATYDVFQNEMVDRFPPMGYPTLYFATSTAKANPIRYSGGFSFSEIDDFIHRSATLSLKKTTTDNSSATPKVVVPPAAAGSDGDL